MEKRMNLLLSLAIKLAITAGLFCLAYLLTNQLSLNPSASTWLYTAAGLISYLMFGILFDRLSQNAWAKFMDFNFILITILFIVAFISLFEVFTGPAGYFCGWPAFVSAIIIFIVSALGIAAPAADDCYERFESPCGS